MDSNEIMKWQEDMFIFSCILYSEEYGIHDPVLSDADFDEHCALLKRWYDELSQEFRDRVPIENLSAGTALGIQFSDSEVEVAIEWRDGVRNGTWWS